MNLKKGICFILFGTFALTLPASLNRFQQDNSGKVQADGGAPPVPPPKKPLPTEPQLNANVDALTTAANNLAQA